MMCRYAKLGLFVVVMTLLLGVAPPAFAGLSAVSPTFNSVTTSNGFPPWYTDANGVSVELPVPPAGDGVNAPTMIYQALDGASNAVAQRAGFDSEAFYFIAQTDPDFATAHGKITTGFGLEAAYGTGSPTEGQQVVFSRIRIKALNLTVAGTYTFSHPWGAETIVLTPADIAAGGTIFYTRDVGLSPGWNPDGAGWLPVAAPGGFYSVLQAANSVSTFLRALSPAPPAGWIGDGVTLSTVMGSPLIPAYNKVRLEGPDANLDGANHNFVETDQFVVAGHMPANTAIPLPLSVDRATSSYVGAAKTVGLFLTSMQGATVTVTDALSSVLFTGPVADASGGFYQSFAVPAATDSITVEVTTADPAFTPATKTVPVVDLVKVTSARYSAGTNSLTVTATSSGFYSAAPPTLTVVGYGVMTVDASGTYTLPPVTLTSPLPPSVTVTSSMGGKNTAPVDDTPLAISVTSPIAGTVWPGGSTQSLGFTLSAAVSVGEFDAWLIDTATGTWYPAGFSAPVPGQTIYAQSFSTALVPSGTYTAVVYYRPDALVWGNWTANAASPFGAATVEAGALTISVTSPTAGTHWPLDSTQSLGFTLSSAVSVGEFDAWLIDTATGTWYEAGFSVPVPAQTDYTQSFSLVGIPAGTYTAVVYYRPDALVWGNWTANASSPTGAVTIP